jgi:hypothetical protein
MIAMHKVELSDSAESQTNGLRDRGYRKEENHEKTDNSIRRSR